MELGTRLTPSAGPMKSQRARKHWISGTGSGERPNGDRRVQARRKEGKVS